VDTDILFTFEGTTYRAPGAFYKTNRVQLPDGRLLHAAGFLETFPPQPTGLSVEPVPQATVEPPK
jgi:hypothetical protein